MNMKITVLFAIAMSAVLVSVPVQAKTGKCVLEVKHRKYLNGPCEVRIDEGGSFSIGAADTRARASRYFAYVTISDGEAQGTWNGEDAETHAQEDLGVLKRDGACWVNDNARVCAYQ